MKMARVQARVADLLMSSAVSMRPTTLLITCNKNSATSATSLLQGGGYRDDATKGRDGSPVTKANRCVNCPNKPPAFGVTKRGHPSAVGGRRGGGEGGGKGGGNKQNQKPVRTWGMVRLRLWSAGEEVPFGVIAGALNGSALENEDEIPVAAVQIEVRRVWRGGNTMRNTARERESTHAKIVMPPMTQKKQMVVVCWWTTLLM